jgi:hypothetical protein
MDKSTAMIALAILLALAGVWVCMDVSTLGGTVLLFIAGLLLGRHL